NLFAMKSTRMHARKGVTPGTRGRRGGPLLAAALFILYWAYSTLGPSASPRQGETPAGAAAAPFPAEHLSQLRPARVERVVDGDTIIVHLDGKRERVRY